MNQTHTWSTWKTVAMMTLALVAVGFAGAVAQQGRVGLQLGGDRQHIQFGNGEENLITREQVRLNVAGAHLILRESVAQAERMDLLVNISVVDPGGHPIAFIRMDGARPASAYSAMTKARAAATLRMSTGPVAPLEGEAAVQGLHVNLSFPMAVAESGGTITTLYGGEPIVVNDQVIGAVGVGGATGEQDIEIARAGIEALLEAIGQ